MPKRSAHPGVALLKPRGRYRRWRARYMDPDTDREVTQALPETATNAEARRAWAVDKSRALIVRRAALDAGASRATGKGLADALGEYFDAHPRLRPRTRAIYRRAVDKLEAWAAKHRVRTVDDLTPPKLVRFRDSLASQPKRIAVKGGKRGEYAGGGRQRAESSINVDLRSVRTVLEYVRRAGMLPRITRDDLADALKQLSVPRERIDFLSKAEIKALLRAAKKHDAATFKITRAEHRKGGPPVGTTVRHVPISGFVRVVLLTGMRLGEAVDLEWSQVDSESEAIHLSAGETKTKRARTVDLSISPSVLGALGEPGEGRVFPELTREIAGDAMDRMKAQFGAPANAGWQTLRRTCSTWLTNSSIYGPGTPWAAAKRAGHSIAVAEARYAGLVRVDHGATTLEAAMGVG